ncbi:DoxX family membrane protein [Nakamurella flava]|uniref:DoxX family membrane protein n=1 Tax=Nakamurella flava TaxID=2576308 RepID=A0A4U6QLD4_9ACTN|nr:MauE/DoxX family redox-associated membrane protein [Nakamurella flava]TKV61303.1 DoxX family membrane protein [Nakamurella flava]
MGRTVDRGRVLDGIGLLARLGLAAVWLISGFAKASAPAETLVAVKAYRLLSSGVAETVAAVLPYLEIALGLLLLIGLATRLAAILSAVVLVIFIAGVISAAARGLSIDCGCFGGGGDVAAGQTNYAGEILRDVGFLALAAWLIVRPGTPWSLDRRLTGR